MATKQIINYSTQNSNKFKKRKVLNLKEKINEIIESKLTIKNGNSSKIIIEENCSSDRFDRLSILFDLKYNNSEEINRITKLWLLNETIYIFEWKILNSNNLQIQILNNLEYQFEKSLIYKLDFQMTKTLKLDQFNRTEPSIGYKPVNRININSICSNFNENQNYFPSIVFEIGYNQSLDDLFQKAEIYKNKTNNIIRIIVVLKFWIDYDYNNNNNNNNNEDNEETFKGIAVIYKKNENGNNLPPIFISFGNNHIIDSDSIKTINKWYGNNTNINTKKQSIELPLSELYYNVPNGEISKNQKNIIIDFTQLKEIILN